MGDPKKILSNSRDFFFEKKMKIISNGGLSKYHNLLKNTIIFMSNYIILAIKY